MIAMKVSSGLLSKVFVLGLGLAFLSCEQNPTEPPPTAPPKIETDNEVTVATQSVGSGGGTVQVTSTNVTINGLVITIPPNSYPDARIFAVSYAPIKSHEFGEFFKPISPLVTIANGGGYADSVMTVKIPISLPAGAQPVAFFYDAKNQRLEPVPMVTFDNSSVTIFTMHFDVNGIASGRTRGKNTPSGVFDWVAKIVVSQATSEMVDLIKAREPVINSGFTPGTDDWEFVNYGSFLPEATGGHCAGQNASSFWYYYEKKKEYARALFGAYDSLHTPPNDIWEDNPLGYRMASAVQQKMDWDNMMLAVYKEYIGAQDDWTWNALAVSMYLTHEPFVIGIHGIDPTSGDWVGHNLTAYKMDLGTRKLSVADPNFPGNVNREISFNGVKFDPYFSALNAADPGLNFTAIKFRAKTATIGWNTIRDLWSSVVVNKQNPGFAEYKLWVNTVPSIELQEYYYTSVDSIDISSIATAPKRASFRVFDRTGTRVLPAAGAAGSRVTRGTLKLVPGENIFGVAVFASETGGQWLWNDFRWIHIIFNEQTVRIEPENFVGKRLEVYNWSAVMKNRPTNLRFNWDFGDGTDIYTVIDDTLAHHYYVNDGQYNIKLEVYTLLPWKKIGEATAVATISGPWIDKIEPDTVSYGMTVRIRGRNFGPSKGTSTISIAGTPEESIVSWSDGEIVAIVPEAFSGGWVKVTVNGAASNEAWLNKGIRRITSISADSLMPGEQLSIRGKWFGVKQGSSKVTFSKTSAPATVVSWSDTLIRVLVPEPDTRNYGKESIKIGTTSSYIQYDNFFVLENVLKTLQQTKKFGWCWVKGMMTYFSALPSPHEYESYGDIKIPMITVPATMTWNGMQFQQEIYGAVQHAVVRITGTVSADGKTIETLVAKEIDSNIVGTELSIITTIELELKNVPFARTSFQGDVTFYYKGSGASAYVQKIKFEEYYVKLGVYTKQYIGFLWNNASYIPEIQVHFTK